MATHDYVIANGTGAAVRSDLNGALAAVVSQNSNATEPATMYAYQWWADTTTGLLKIRNSSNSAWITIGTLASANLGLLSLAGGTMTGVLAVTAGTAALPGIAVSGDTNTGIYSPGADQVAISTSGTGRLFVNAAGLVDISNTTSDKLTLSYPGFGIGTFGVDSTGSLLFKADEANTQASSVIQFKIDGGEKLRIDSSGNLGLGVTPSAWSGLTSLSIGSTGSSISSAANDNLYLTSGAYFNGTNWIYKTTSQLVSSYQQLSGIHRWNIAAGGTAGNTITFTQAMTLDASGRLGIGTTGPSYRLDVQENTANTITRLLNTATTTNSLATQIIAGNNGSTSFQIDVDGLGSVFGTGARLGTTTNHFLSFMTNSTEKARIDSSGRLLVGTSSFTDTANGFLVAAGGSTYATSTSTPCANFNRLTDDGELLVFKQANTQEGSISVSGTTVSYNGAHLSRWSQLSSGAERTEILRGSVLSNINEMCEWPDEDNEQLNRMKVSDVEGDKNVSGVFQSWDDDDDTYTDDFYCAMTGDFIIRIAEGVTVERGDLLMSAGDGTAKPQDDDIIRSKTIAKVTSTNVSCTYEDGSYCVPCVLMAC